MFHKDSVQGLKMLRFIVSLYPPLQTPLGVFSSLISSCTCIITCLGSTMKAPRYNNDNNNNNNDKGLWLCLYTAASADDKVHPGKASGAKVITETGRRYGSACQMPGNGRNLSPLGRLWSHKGALSVCSTFGSNPQCRPGL